MLTSEVVGGAENKFSAYSVEAITSNDVWVSGSVADLSNPYGGHMGKTYRWQGGTWEPQPIGAVFYSMWASSPSDVWGTGDDHYRETTAIIPANIIVMRFDGVRWSTIIKESHDGGAGTSVGGAAGGSAWITSSEGFGEPPAMYWAHLDPAGGKFVPQPRPPRSKGYSSPYGGPWLWFASDTRLWFASETPAAVFVLDSGAWRTDDSACPLQFVATALWGTSETDLWAVGKGGKIAHRDASGWHNVESGVTDDLAVVDGSGPNDVWAGGSHVLLHYTAP